MPDLCAHLAWDSAFFQRRIARVNVNRLTNAQVDEALAWCAGETVDCLYFLAESDDLGTVRAVEAHGFVHTDVRVTLEHSQPTAVQSTRSRLCQPEDIPALKAMAQSHHRQSRFYYDGHFTQAECDALYSTWIERSCEGTYADAVLVVERDGQPAGYVTCEMREGYGEIGLLGVGEAWQGQGIGRELINDALGWFAGRGVERVEVVTQGRNVQAQRAYQRCGFVTKQLQLWYHRWFEPLIA